jgi:hypothetical protein
MNNSSSVSLPGVRVWNESFTAIKTTFKHRLTDLTMAPKVKKVKNGTPPPIDKLLKPAIGIALALVGYQFLKGINSGVSQSQCALKFSALKAFAMRVFSYNTPCFRFALLSLTSSDPPCRRP